MSKKVVLAILVIAIIVVDIVFDRQRQAQIYTCAVGILSWTFAFRYGRYSPWRTNIGGRALMYFSIALGAVGFQLFSAWTFGDYPFRPEARALVFGTLIMVLAYLNWIMVEVQRKRKREDRECVRKIVDKKLAEQREAGEL